MYSNRAWWQSVIATDDVIAEDVSAETGRRVSETTEEEK